MDHMTEEEALKKAIDIVGTSSALAAELGITKGAIPQWKRVPAEHCPTIERITNGEVRCEALRSDVEWSVLRQKRNLKSQRLSKSSHSN